MCQCFYLYIHRYVKLALNMQNCVIKYSYCFQLLKDYIMNLKYYCYIILFLKEELTIFHFTV